MKLKQKKYFKKKEFEIRDNGLFIKFSDLLNNLEFEVPFEEIEFKRILRKTKIELIPLIAGLVFAFVAILSLIEKLNKETEVSWGTIFLAFVLSFIGIIISIIKTKKLLFLPIAKGQLEFYDERPSKEELDNFIKTLEEKSKNFLKKKYGKVDLNFPIENQLNKLYWLLDKQVITEDEFEEMKSTLTGKNENSKSIIGYKSS